MLLQTRCILNMTQPHIAKRWMISHTSAVQLSLSGALGRPCEPVVHWRQACGRRQVGPPGTPGCQRETMDYRLFALPGSQSGWKQGPRPSERPSSFPSQGPTSTCRGPFAR